MSVKAKPDGYNTATPYLIIKDAAQAIPFYQKALNAQERARFEDPTSGKVMHAEIKIGDSVIMISDEIVEMGIHGPHSLGGSPVSILLYVEDVDALYHQALKAGAEAISPLDDQFYGDRSGTLKAPFGHVWTIASHIEDVSLEEMRKRMAEVEVSA